MHVGFESYYQAGVELGKLKTAVTTTVNGSQRPAMLVGSDAMETGASGTSSVSLMEGQTAVEGDTTRPPSEMQVSSSDEALVAPGGNNGIAVIESPSPMPPVSTTPPSAVSSSSDDASAAGTRINSTTPVHSTVNDPPAQ